MMSSAEPIGEPSSRRFGLGAALMTLPAVVWMVAFFVLPLLLFGAYSFMTAKLYDVSLPLTLQAYRDALSTDVNRTLALNSVVVGLGAAAATVAIGLPVAYWLRFCAGRWQVLVLFLITGTFFASYLVRIYAWRSILGENGLLNSGLQRLGVLDEPLAFLLYNRFSVTVALVHIFLPYVVLVLYAGFRPVSPAFVEAAQDLGANALVRWRRVILPLVAAPAATSFALVFILSAADYVTPQFLGGTDGALLGVRIQAALTGTGNWPLGAALSFLMLAFFLVFYVLILALLRALRLDRVRFVS